MLKYLLSAVTTFIFISTTTTAQSDSVTFECNMGVQICETNFDPAEDSLLLMGSFNSWSGTLMTQISDSIYSVTLGLYTDSTYYFKFYSTQGNGYWEGDPNRELLVPPGGTTFSDYFDRDSVCDYMPVTVTFNCNMAVQICEMNFDPAVDSIYLKGEFNNWSDDNPMEPVSDTVWSATLELQAGHNYQFKFYNTHNGGIWEQGDNREIEVPPGGVIFSDYFDGDSLCNLTPAPVTFNCNMAVQICESNFDPVVDSVYLRGEFNGWSEDNPMEPVSDTIWSLMLELEPGYSYQFKYYSSHDGGIWEQGDNRELYVPLNGTTFYDYFNYDTICNPVPVELSLFNAVVNDGVVSLRWITATETNNRGFEVERSGKSDPAVRTDFEDENRWKTIGFAEGCGTTVKPHNYTFRDDKLSAGKYLYRLKQIDFNGAFQYSDVIEVDVNTPAVFSLSQNYPNPFNPITSIQYAVGSKQFVTLIVYDVLGNEVATLVNEEKPAGRYTVKFDGSKLGSGIYIYRMKAGNFTAAKKLILLK